MLFRKLRTARRVFTEKGLQGLVEIARVKAALWRGAIASPKPTPPPSPRQGAGTRVQNEAEIAMEAADLWSEGRQSAAVRDMSHWEGEGRWADREAWRAIGAVHFQMARELCAHVGLGWPIRRMIEWGPGGGSNAIAFSKVLESFTAVDISKPNLDECRRQLEAIPFGGFTPVHLTSPDPWVVAADLGTEMDLFLSTAVYQHFPGKAYGLEVTRIAYHCLRSPGVALIQIRYDDGKSKYQPKVSDYREQFVTFTSYGISEFWDLATEVGFTPLYVKLGTHTNYATFFLAKPARP